MKANELKVLIYEKTGKSFSNEIDELLEEVFFHLEENINCLKDKDLIQKVRQHITLKTGKDNKEGK